jgi:hypothetical protein
LRDTWHSGKSNKLGEKMNIDKELEIFKKWWDNTFRTGKWTTLERMAALDSWTHRASLIPSVRQIDEILEHCDNACNDDGSSLNRFEYAQAIHKLMEVPK